MTRAVRLLQIIELLRSGCGVTTTELAARFGVSRRTVQEDILMLQGEPFYLALESCQRHEWRLTDPRQDGPG